MAAVKLVLFSQLIAWSAGLIESCQPIRVDICMDIGYNGTSLPNSFQHETQQEVQLSLRDYKSLFVTGCSSQLRFFLCSIFVPYCNVKVPQSIGPCRPICERVKSRCLPVMQRFGFKWPSYLNCSKLPTHNHPSHMCMDGPKPKNDEILLPHPSSNVPTKEHYIRSKNQDQTIPLKSTVNQNPDDHCKQFRSPEKYNFINRTGRCAQKCDADILFEQSSKYNSDILICFGSVTCFTSTLITLITFCRYSSKFGYPERAMIYMSVCYNIYSIAYIVRLIEGRHSSSCQFDSHHNESILIQDGRENFNCTISFVLLYFFGIASALWWVILTYTWLLAARLEWSARRIEQQYVYFHIIAWCLPSLKTMAILILGTFDADELTGTCYVGNQNDATLLGFVIIPSIIYLIIGMIFMITGILKFLQNVNQYRFKLKIGIFAMLYTFPATSLLAANLYEYSSRDGWYKRDSRDGWYKEALERPNVQIFQFRIFMSFFMGVVTYVFICSGT